LESSEERRGRVVLAREGRGVELEEGGQLWVDARGALDPRCVGEEVSKVREVVGVNEPSGEQRGRGRNREGARLEALEEGRV
jgi:hypothetical protein